MSFFKETISRWSSDSPKYFKRIGKMGVGLTASGMSMLATNVLPTSVHVPAIITTIGGYMMTAGFVMAGIAKLTVDNSFDSNESEAIKKGKDSVG